MRLQELISSRRFAVGAIVGIAFFAVAWIYAFNSPQYKQASAVVDSKQLSALTGKVKFSILVGFNVSSVEGRSSTVSIYVFGERASGYLRVSSSNGPQGAAIDAATFGDQVLRPPFIDG